MKRNWIQDQPMASSLVIQKNVEDIVFFFFFFCHSMRIVEIGKARFIENGDISGSVEIEEVRVQVSLSITS